MSKNTPKNKKKKKAQKPSWNCAAQSIVSTLEGQGWNIISFRDPPKDK